MIKSLFLLLGITFMLCHKNKITFVFINAFMLMAMGELSWNGRGGVFVGPTHAAHKAALGRGEVRRLIPCH
jgi:hypothetical protein